MKLKEIAHCRTGDKGNLCNVCLIPYDDAHYPLLKKVITAESVKKYYRQICQGEVKRYEVDSICSLNFVLYQSLGGGVTRSLAQDKHGKSLGMALLEMDLPGNVLDEANMPKGAAKPVAV